MSPSVQHIIDQLELSPHPEGGFFRETYRSAGTIEASGLPVVYGGARNYSTCIYFLLTSDRFSALHRIRQDEIWHFYDGSPIRLHIITESGKHTEHIIGRDIAQGETPQFVVPGGCWFGAEVIDENSYSLVGCTVAPGFDFDDFELNTSEELLMLFPQHKTLIERLTHV